MGTKKRSAEKLADTKANKGSMDSVRTDANAIVVAKFSQHRFRHLFQRGGKYAWALLGVILLGAVIAGFLLYQSHKSAGVVRGITPEELVSSTLDELKNSEPSADADEKTKAQYYKNLMFFEAKTNNFKAADAAYKRWEAIDNANMSYYDYMSASIYLHKADDGTAAIRALDRALIVMPKTDNPDTGYSQELVKQRIETMRKEYSS